MLNKELSVNSIDVVKKILGDDYEFLKIQKQRMFGLEIQNYRLIQEIEQLQHKNVNFIDLTNDLTQIIVTHRDNIGKEDIKNLFQSNYMLTSFNITTVDKLKEMIIEMKSSAIKCDVAKENMNYLVFSDKEIRKDKFLESISVQIQSLDTLKYEINRMINDHNNHIENKDINSRLDALNTNLKVFTTSGNMIEMYSNLSKDYANVKEVLSKVYSKYHNLIQDSKLNNEVEQVLTSSHHSSLVESSKPVFDTMSQEDLLRMLITQSIMIEDKLAS